MILSLYDFTGTVLRPWAEAGHACLALDILHPVEGRSELFLGSGGRIDYYPVDLHNETAVHDIITSLTPKFVFGFPVCTDLAVSGTRHWKKKAAADPMFQVKAMQAFIFPVELCETLSILYAFENPVGVLSSVWRKPSFSFDPFEYGGYLPLDDVNPVSSLIPARDAYRKATYIWCDKRLEKPLPKPVLPVTVGQKNNFAPQFAFTGGASLKTKMIRSATPRGFAIAAYQAWNSYI